jgi:hypothetical protein
MPIARTNRIQMRKQTTKNTQNTQTIISDLTSPEEANAFIAMFQRLQNASPTDSNGFLQVLYDPSMLPHDLDSKALHTQEKHLTAASIPLTMIEGYHAFSHTKPIWTQLPHEPKSYFETFRSYLLSADRNLEHTADTFEFDAPGFSRYTLREAYILFYWPQRARSYDILKPVAAAKLRDQRILLAEDAHFTLSNGILKQLQEEIQERENDDEDGRPWAGLKASELISALTSMVQLQRVSLELPSHGPKLKETGFSAAPFASVERGIRESTQNYLGTTEAGLTPAQKMQQDINRALAEDPDAAAALQAAAIDVLLKARAQRPPLELTATPTGYGPPENT